MLTEITTSIKTELLAMSGVQTVDVSGTLDDLNIQVLLKSMAMEPYDLVIRKKIELQNRYPEFMFNFCVDCRFGGNSKELGDRIVPAYRQ